MKRIKLISTFAIVMLMLTACSNGVSQEEYESVSAAASISESENAVLNKENESLSAENKSLSEKHLKLLDEKSTQVVEQFNDATVESWLTTSFGENSVCLSSNSSYLQCLSGKTYSITQEGISEINNDVLYSLSLLAYLTNLVNYDSISIKFFDDSNVHILDIVLTKVDGTFGLDAILCNVEYNTEIISALKNL